VNGQTIRSVTLDTARNPPMQYLVARRCPKLLEGHTFYACACYGPAVADQGKPSIQIACEYLAAHDYGATRVLCNHGGEKVTGSGVQFGIPIVRHATQDDDGSHPD